MTDELKFRIADFLSNIWPILILSGIIYAVAEAIIRHEIAANKRPRQGLFKFPKRRSRKLDATSSKDTS